MGLRVRLKLGTRTRGALGLAAAVYVLGLALTLLLWRALTATELQLLQRSADGAAATVHDELLRNTQAQVLAQQRMAARLGDNYAFSEAQWRRDAVRYLTHHLYYRALAVTDPQLELRWIESRGVPSIAPGTMLTLDEHYVGRLAQARQPGELFVTSPYLIADGTPVINFLTVLHDGAEVVGFLVAIMAVPEAVDAMLPANLRDQVRVSLRSGELGLYPPPGRPQPAPGGVFARRLLDVDGDGRGFELEVELGRELVQDLSSQLPAAVLGFGMVLSLLAAFAAWLASHSLLQAGELRRSNQRLLEEAAERGRVQRSLEHLASHDPLTGLPNRLATRQLIEQRLAALAGSRQILAVMFLDLDQFKDINDSLGHDVGDALLAQMPHRLSVVLRDDDHLGRHGGDEFLIIAQRDDVEGLRQLAEDLLKLLEASFELHGHRLFVGASIGVAVHPDGGHSAADLIRNADTALFKAKHSGRNRVHFYTRELHAEVEQRLRLSRELREALERDDFALVYQPIVDLADGRLSGLEALLRWRRADGQQVAPVEFIRVAEASGLIGRLCELTLHRALADYRRWRRDGRSLPWLSINISGVQIRDPRFPERLAELLRQHGIPAAALHLEITEEVLIENLARNRSVLQRLDAMGLRIVVDDFGVGYSSLAYLKNFPITLVKIDRGFIRDLPHKREDQAIVRTVCSLARDLGMRTVAEGVEDAAQLALLCSYGCEYAQGFLLARPQPAQSIEPMLAGHRPWLALLEAWR